MSDAGQLIVTDAPLPAAERVNLLGMSRAGLQAFLVGLGEKPYRAHQLMKWIYHHHVTDFDQMTDLGKALREKLRLAAAFQHPYTVLVQQRGYVGGSLMPASVQLCDLLCSGLNDSANSWARPMPLV